MSARELGFTSSWKMLTRDKGWVKPVLVLALVGWIPILGQIAILGYALEWGRLTAWGVDAAPKQRGVNYGKVLSTGGIAFLVGASIVIAASVASALLFGSSAAAVGSLFAIGAPIATAAAYLGATSMGALGLASLVFNLCATAFVNVAMMRSTIYDSFSAGWRLDRICQMIARDWRGFLHLVGITLIASIVNAVYSGLVGLVCAVFFAGSLLGAFAVTGGTMAIHPLAFLVDALVGMGPALVLLVVLLGVGLVFIGVVIETAMRLVVVNAVGQWFARFDLARWGLSSDPLPDGVPSGGSAESAKGPMPSAPADAPQQGASDEVDGAPAACATNTQEAQPAGRAVPSDDGAGEGRREPERGPILLPPVSDLLDGGEPSSEDGRVE